MTKTRAVKEVFGGNLFLYLVAAGVTSGGITFNNDYYDSPNAWKADNPTYQIEVDKYIMRRTVENLVAYCEINPATFLESEMSDWLDVSGVSETDGVVVSGSDSSITLDSSWYLYEIDCQDSPKKAVVTGKWRRYGEWTLVKVSE